MDGKSNRISPHDPVVNMLRTLVQESDKKVAGLAHGLVQMDQFLRHLLEISQNTITRLEQIEDKLGIVREAPLPETPDATT